MGSPAEPPITAQLLSDEDAWDRIETDWSALYDVSPQATAALHFDWMRTWWRVYGARHSHPTGLRVIAARRGAELVGVLPLYEHVGHTAGLRLRSLRFLSTGEAQDEETCPDYLNALCRPGAEDAASAALEVLAGRAWDRLTLSDVPEASPLFADGALRVLGGRVLPAGECPFANLQGGFEAYLQRLSSNSRQQARRLLRDVEKAGAVFELADEGRAEGCFADLIRLHQERWVGEGKPGCFAAAGFTEFHRKLVGLWVPRGRAVLAHLSVSGRPVAVLYGFVSNSRFEFYQSGVVTDAPGLRSPGIQAHLLLMRALAGRGVGTYDFLRGSSSYKGRLATDENRLVSAEVWRPTFRATVHRSVGLLRRAAGRLVRKLRGRTPPTPGPTS